MPDVGPLAVAPLTELLKEIFLAAGLTPEEAGLVAAHVVDAEARESRSQGLVRVPAYVDWATRGRITSGATLTVERDQGSVLVLDARNGWGHVAAVGAMDRCVARAAQTGVCLAVVRNTNHIGRLGYYVERAAAQGMIGLIACGGNPASAWVAPWGGIAPLFGTNPLAIGFPRRDGPPVVVDISTTQGARGNVLLAQKTGQWLPDGWAFDKTGRPTRDPMQALPPHGTLAPLGGHKGYALAVAVEILCGVLQGLWPPDTSGNFVGAIRVEAFLPLDTYHASLDGLIGQIKGGPTRPGVAEILLPGEGSDRRGRASAAHGVMVAAEMWQEITSLARRLGVAHPLLAAAGTAESH
ncbi:MAG: Ldh family oxidoreductase [Armatimonadota bacterium]|nr:Ldh family oxidoreductase [Armatimonadota bacterium]